MSKLDFKSAVKHNKNLKFGGYSTIVTVIVLIVVVVLNLMFEQLSLTIDLTEEELYTVGDDSMEIIDALEQDVEIYGFYASGDEDGSYAKMVIKFLEEYANLSSRLSFAIKDPVSDPGFANQYMTSTTETISSGNIVVASAETGRYKILDLSDMLEISYSSTSSSGYDVTGWNAEAAITGAVQYVTSENTPVIYQLSGHGEVMLDANVTDYLNTSNFDVETISLVSGDEIDPTVFSTILINNPKTDITEMEYDTLLSYLEKGGRMIFMAEYNIPLMTNFDKLLERFGLSINRAGYVIETNANNYYSYPELLIPNKQDAGEETHEIIANLEDGEQIMMLAPTAIEELDTKNRSTKLTNLIYTSDDALIKGKNATTYAYEDGDIEGPFNLAVIAEEQEQVGSDVKTAKVAVIGSSAFVDMEASGGFVTNGNYLFFMNVCSYLQDEVDTLYIPAKTFENTRMSTTMGTAVTGGIVFVLVIPLVIVGMGVFIWIRRKNL